MANPFFEVRSKNIVLTHDEAFNWFGNLKKGFHWVAENDSYERTVNRLRIKPLGVIALGLIGITVIEAMK